jgi:hypothetical protein
MFERRCCETKAHPYEETEAVVAKEGKGAKEAH